MPDYETRSGEALVAEVARRMGNKYRVNQHGDTEQDIGGGWWELWMPLERCEQLEDVKRDIERRKWNRRMWTSVRGSYYHTEIGFPDKLGEAHASTEPRAWLVAYLRATDAEKEASSEG